MAITNSTIDMTWTAATDNFGVVSYHIYQSTDNVVYTEIHSTDGATYAYTAIGLSEGTKYYFKQTAKDAAGNESLYGNTVEATTLGGAPAYTYLLDDYPGSAAAYSLRKLSESQTQAIRVRRSSDNAATDVYFYDDPSKSIDLLSDIEVGGTLGDWAGSDTVYVRKWYDQGGNNNDLLQTTNTNQPRIINSGVLDTKNGLSCIEFDGLDDKYELGSGLPAIAHGNAFSLFTVTSNNSTEYAGAILASTSNLNDRFVVFRDTRTSINRNVYIKEGGVDHNYDLSIPRVEINQVLQSFHTNGTLRSAFDNGSAGVSDSLISGTYNNDNFKLGVQRSTSSYMDGQIQEIIIYESDQSSNRTSIEANINEHYSIWVVTSEVDAQLIQADTDNVSDTVIEINGVRSSVSDTAVANLISRNVTVITN